MREKHAPSFSPSVSTTYSPGSSRRSKSQLGVSSKLLREPTMLPFLIPVSRKFRYFTGFDKNFSNLHLTLVNSNLKCQGESKEVRIRVTVVTK